MLEKLAARSQVATFLVGGGLSAVLDVGLMQLLIVAGAQYQLAATVGFGVSLLFNYAFHARLTYRAPMGRASFARYLCIVALNYGLTLACVTAAAHLAGPPVWGKAVSLPLVAVIGYLSGKYWTFTATVPPCPMTAARSFRTALTLAGATILTFAWLAWRAHGLYPSVFADELIYSTFARHTPLAEVTIPSYLYFALYHLTSLGGAHFLDWARAFNCALFAGALPFIYLTARRYTSARRAALVTACALLAPLNSFTVYFMPETPYYFAFAVLAWLVLTRTGMAWATQALLAGALLGAMMLIKVHALFLLPALALYLLLARLRDGAPAALGAALLAVLAFFGARFGLGYLLAGPAGLHLVGEFYGHTAHPPLPALIAPAFISARGHLEALAILAGVPLAGLAAALAQPRQAWQDRPAFELRLFTLLMVGAALVMTVFYTAAVAGVGPGEGLRLHGRYYDFLFPLLFLCAALDLEQPLATGAARRWCGAALLVLVALAVWKLPSYPASLVDGPEIAVLALRSGAGIVLALLAAASLALWMADARRGARAYLMLLLPLYLVAATGKVNGWEHTLRQPGTVDRAATMLRGLRGAGEPVFIVGDQVAELMRAKFELDDPDAELRVLAPGAALADTPFTFRWVMAFGEHALPREVEVVARGAGFALARVRAPWHRLGRDRLSVPLPGQVLAAVGGMSAEEPWGRWSNGPQVTLQFRQPLPRVLRLVLTAQGFGPNAGADFVLHAGAAQQHFTVAGALQPVFLTVPTDGTVHTVTIDVPHPTVPPGGDTRALGLGLADVTIGSGD